MPIYVYECSRCATRTDVFQRRPNAAREVLCPACGSAETRRVFGQFSVARSEIDELQRLDPKYFKKVDQAIANTPEADPMRHLQRMVPFDRARDPGDPIDF